MNHKQFYAHHDLFHINSLIYRFQSGPTIQFKQDPLCPVMLSAQNIPYKRDSSHPETPAAPNIFLETGSSTPLAPRIPFKRGVSRPLAPAAPKSFSMSDAWRQTFSRNGTVGAFGAKNFLQMGRFASRGACGAKIFLETGRLAPSAPKIPCKRDASRPVAPTAP